LRFATKLKLNFIVGAVDCIELSKLACLRWGSDEQNPVNTKIIVSKEGEHGTFHLTKLCLYIFRACATHSTFTFSVGAVGCIELSEVACSRKGGTWTTPLCTPELPSVKKENTALSRLTELRFLIYWPGKTVITQQQLNNQNCRSKTSAKLTFTQHDSNYVTLISNIVKMVKLSHNLRSILNPKLTKSILNLKLTKLIAQTDSVVNSKLTKSEHRQ
jgi:hypothetical protein